MKAIKICPVCGSDVFKGRSTVPFKIHHTISMRLINECCECHSFWQDSLEEKDIISHLDTAIYLSHKNEGRLRLERQEMFNCIYNIIKNENCIKGNIKLLDVGSCYGHMIDFLSNECIKCEGVEPVERLRNITIEKGITTYQDIMNADGVYNVITFIDSLYYMKNPFDTLEYSKNILAKDGVIIIRITNRTPFIRVFFRICSNSYRRKLFGDQYIAFSHYGMLKMIKKHFLTIRSIKYIEQRKCKNYKEIIMFKYAAFFSEKTRIPLSPGIIYVLSK